MNESQPHWTTLLAQQLAATQAVEVIEPADD